MSRHTSAGSTFYLFDAQGNTAHRLDGSGNVLSSHVYDAFGAESSTASTYDPYASYQAASGYRLDTETGLLLAGHRYYDPAAGRFLNRDPIGFDGGINLFRYASNNPGCLSDPTGFDANWAESFAEYIDKVSDSSQAWYRANTPWQVAGTINSVIQLGRSVTTGVLRIGCAEGKLSVHPTLENFLGTVGDTATIVGAGELGVLGRVGTVAAEEEVSSTLFHYTTEEGMNGIVESEQLNPSLKALRPKDARYGDGQYLTDIKPGSLRPGQLSQRLVGLPWQGAQFSNYVQIDVSGLEVVQGRANVYVIPNSAPLDLTGRIVSYGRAP